MDNINKICFAYPVVYKEDMTKEESCVPSPLVSAYGSEKGSVIDLLVNVGIMVSLKAKTHINVVINKKGDIDKPEETNTNGKFENLKSNILHNKQAVILTSLFLENVEFKGSGEYEIRVSLFGSNSDGEKIPEPIDTYHSYFYFLAIGNSEHA